MWNVRTSRIADPMEETRGRHYGESRVLEDRGGKEEIGGRYEGKIQGLFGDPSLPLDKRRLYNP